MKQKLQSGPSVVTSMPNESPLPARKQALRRQLLASRTGFFPDAESFLVANQRLHTKALELIDGLRCNVVFLYLATPDEVQTKPLVDRFLERGITLLVPKLVPGNQMRAVRFKDWDSLKVGQLGILTPHSDIEYPTAIDVALVPGLAFTRDGGRLGYGKGYYDRWLSTQTSVRRIGLCFTQQILASLPTDTHDEPLDTIVTPDELFETGARCK